MSEARDIAPPPRSDADAITRAIEDVRTILALYVFRPRDEADLQDMVASVLGRSPLIEVRREVIAEHGRYDVLAIVQVDGVAVSIVIELKVAGSVAAVERQAQRYAMTVGVDAVIVATTSHRLGRKLDDLLTLGGKPFAVSVLRAM